MITVAGRSPGGQSSCHGGLLLYRRLPTVHGDARNVTRPARLFRGELS
jgi:hypothetical protein